MFFHNYRLVSHCKHYMISQLETGKYVIVGAPKVHGSLEEMVTFHSKVGPPAAALYGQMQFGHSDNVIIGYIRG